MSELPTVAPVPVRKAAGKPPVFVCGPGKHRLRYLDPKQPRIGARYCERDSCAYVEAPR